MTKYSAKNLETYGGSNCMHYNVYFVTPYLSAGVLLISSKKIANPQTTKPQIPNPIAISPPPNRQKCAPPPYPKLPRRTTTPPTYPDPPAPHPSESHQTHAAACPPS